MQDTIPELERQQAAKPLAPEPDEPARAGRHAADAAALHRVVVVGGGAGGLELATRLGDTPRAPRQGGVRLVERNRIHIWKPLLHEVAAGCSTSTTTSSTTWRTPTGTTTATATARWSGSTAPRGR